MRSPDEFRMPADFSGLSRCSPMFCSSSQPSEEEPMTENIVDTEIVKAKSWRDVLPAHPAAELFPLMDQEELRELAADIKKHGLREPPVFYRDPELGICVLDGRNRLNACELIGRETVTAAGQPIGSIREHANSFDPVAYVISKNIHRRHLTAEQRRELIVKRLKAEPEQSDRAIAKQVQADHKTVGTVRAEIERRGEIPHVEVRTDTKGRNQPATKPARPVATPDVPCAPLTASAEATISHSSPDGQAEFWQLIEAIDRVYELAQAGVSSEALTQTGKKKVQGCLRDLAGILRKLREEITKSTAGGSDETNSGGRKFSSSADVDAALKDWRHRHRASHELSDLALAVRRAAGRGLHLSEKQWRTVREVEAAAAIAGMQAA
jgi:hypothetical protein